MMRAMALRAARHHRPAWTCLALVAAAVTARPALAAPAVRSIHALPARPTKAAIQKAVAGGLSWGAGHTEDDGAMFQISSKGEVSYEFGFETNQERCLEKPRGRFAVTASAIELTCMVVHVPLLSVDDDGAPVPFTPTGGTWTTFRFQVKLVSADLLVLQSPEQQRIVLHAARDAGGTAYSGGPAVLAELVPGSADTALFAQVTDRLTHAPEDGFPSVVLLQGPPAREARDTTEIFYASEDGREAAEELAALLQPLIGGVTPKPWPGAWDHDVVVVVGKKPAPMPAGE